ncbi:NifB/NifX family molybdenum-iron cluster-binding protein [Psychromonas sp. KJ10-10]|uniref:NifB/NifX family molybdenum-iron cluster-binding protein n=1 Tax=Psychromonas sp. KJ10-10 TaxID=3391823 RepID=UPI0039B3F8D5
MTVESPSLQIAIASTDGQNIDGHFGSCEHFYIYKLDENNIEYIELREAEGGRGVEKNAYRAQIISDCHLMFCARHWWPSGRLKLLMQEFIHLKVKVALLSQSNLLHYNNVSMQMPYHLG